MAPHPQAHSYDIWHHDERPTAGTFSFGGQVVLFTLITDINLETTTWAYIPLTDEDVAELGGKVFESEVEMGNWILSRGNNPGTIRATAQDFQLTPKN